ncbi:MAG: ketopantoate reductase family protein [Vicinamibacteria bacterium]|nr:ketopantoate reductase family protein [Vicinamibacteria bacterium]
MVKQRPTWAVIGSGAMASVFAARLARANAVTTEMVGSWDAAIAAIRRDGIRVEAGRGGWQTSVTIHDYIAAPAAFFDVALVLVKSFQTARVLPWLARILKADGLAVTLQNGADNREMLTRSLGEKRVAWGVIYGGATALAPGSVREVAAPRVTLASDFSPGRDLSGVKSVLDAAGCPCEITPDGARVFWHKLAVNCAINPLGWLHGRTNGELVRDPAIVKILRHAATEVGAVARAQGVELGPALADEVCEVALRTAANRCSMLQDADRCAPTEIDSLCGWLLKQAERYNINTPTIRGLYEHVSAGKGAR